MTDTTQDNSAASHADSASSAQNSTHTATPVAAPSAPAQALNQAANQAPNQEPSQQPNQAPQHSEQSDERGPARARGRRRPNSGNGQNHRQNNGQNNGQSEGQTDGQNQSNRPPARGQNRNQPQRQAPATARQPHAQLRQASPALERLFALYPGLFGAQFLPLKLGVYQDLLARHPDDFKRDELKLAMGQHARSTRYLESVANGHPRHDLDGQPVEAVSTEHVHHALIELFRRRQARSRDDLRPGLTQRLIQAIEASGLSREDYMDRVRVQNESQNALVEDAFAELGMQAARREALVRTFEASGHTVAEFASMYGMDAAEVSRVLAMMRPAVAPVPTPASPASEA